MTNRAEHPSAARIHTSPRGGVKRAKSKKGKNKVHRELQKAEAGRERERRSRSEGKMGGYGRFKVKVRRIPKKDTPYTTVRENPITNDRR